MKNHFYILLLCIICIACEKKQQTSFYFWKTSYQLSANEQKYLDSLGVQKLYVRFFDVDIKNGKPLPIGEIKIQTQNTKQEIRWRLGYERRPAEQMTCNRPYRPRVKNFVYLMRDNRTGYYKIGLSSNPQQRETTLQAEAPNITLVKAWTATAQEEKSLHEKYGSLRIRGEWFRLAISHVSEIFEYFEGREEFNYA